MDFKNKRIRVHHSMYLRNKSNWKRKDYTKTEDKETIKVLKEWKQRQAKIGIDDFVFSYDETPMIKSTLARIIQRYAKLAKVHRIQVKGLNTFKLNGLKKERE